MKSPLNILLLALPLAAYLEMTHGNPTMIFIASALAILPLAGLMGEATEDLAVRLGSAVGGLLNATFGNATELIIALFALHAGKLEVVKASIVGSVLGNLLLVLGLSVLVGGLRYRVQRFNVGTATTIASLLTVSLLALMVPTIFDVAARAVVQGQAAALDVNLSDAAAVILIGVYLAYLYFTLISHKDLLSNTEVDRDTAETGEVGGEGAAEPDTEQTRWSAAGAVGLLLASTLGVALMSEFLVGALDEATASLGLTEFFVGLILIPIIGNAAEHFAAVSFAMKNKMDLSLTISLGSTVQVALLVAPVLVLAGLVMGQPMNLVVTPLELAAVASAVVITNSVVRDGETNWFEGVLLLAVYAMLALAVFYFPAR